MCRALIGHEYVKNVIDERGDRERIDWLEWDLLASFCHSASLIRAHFIGRETSGTPVADHATGNRCAPLCLVKDTSHQGDRFDHDENDMQIRTG